VAKRHLTSCRRSSAAPANTPLGRGRPGTCEPRGQPPGPVSARSAKMARSPMPTASLPFGSSLALARASLTLAVDPLQPLCRACLTSGGGGSEGIRASGGVKLVTEKPPVLCRGWREANRLGIGCRVQEALRTGQVLIPKSAYSGQ
jgi:hypothetical protein